MKPKPTRASAAGRTYLLLQAKARRERRPTDELIQLYVLEGFLARLASSRHASKLVLKGGVLLAAYDVRRPTRDVDLQGRQLPNDGDAMLRLVRDVAAVILVCRIWVVFVLVAVVASPADPVRGIPCVDRPDD